MSQDTALDETLPEANPVGTQDVSSSEPTPFIEKPDETRQFDKILTPEPPAENEAEKVKAEEEFKKQVAEAVKHQFDVVENWQPSIVTKFVIECPSGQKVLAKHMDTMDLMNADLIEELDFFTKRLFPAEYDSQGTPIEPEEGERKDIWATLRDAQRRKRFLHMTGRLMAVASIKPKIIFDGVATIDDPDNEGEKKVVFGYQVEDIQEQIKLFGKPVPKIGDPKTETYAGPIDFSDRMMFLGELNKPLGMIEPFREEPDAMLASMESVESPRVSAEQPI